MEPVPVPSPARKMYWLPIHQYFLEFFLYWSVHQYTSPKHTWTSMWPKGEGQFSLGENFQKKFWGWKIFPTPFLVNFDVFLVDFDAKTQMRGENLPKNYKNGLVDWFGRKNVTITISIHCQKCNGYPVQSWTGWTDWTDQSKLGLVTHTLVEGLKLIILTNGIISLLEHFPVLFFYAFITDIRFAKKNLH